MKIVDIAECDILQGGAPIESAHHIERNAAVIRGCNISQCPVVTEGVVPVALADGNQSCPVECNRLQRGHVPESSALDLDFIRVGESDSGNGAVVSECIRCYFVHRVGIFVPRCSRKLQRVSRVSGINAGNNGFHNIVVVVRNQIV